MQATKSFEKIKVVIKEALSKVKKVVKGAIKIIPKKDYREGYQINTGRDPFICPKCGKEMDIWKIRQPKYGVIYEGLKEIKRGKYEEKEQETSIERGDRCTINQRRGKRTIPAY